MPEHFNDDDSALVARCLAGDGSAWAALGARYQRLVHAIVRRAGLDDDMAADVFQTVFLRLLQQLPRIAEPGRLQAWIVTTAKREAWLQRKRSERLVSLTVGDGDEGFADDDESDLADEAPGPDDTLAHWQMVAQVQRALDRLDERCRSLLLVLFGADDVSYADLAQRQGLPVGSIGPTRARCLAKLRRLIE